MKYERVEIPPIIVIIIVAGRCIEIWYEENLLTEMCLQICPPFFVFHDWGQRSLIKLEMLSETYAPNWYGPKVPEKRLTPLAGV